MDDPTKGTTVREHKRKRTVVEGAEENGWQAAMARTPRRANPYDGTALSSNFALACYRAWNDGWDRAYNELVAENSYLPEKD